MGRNNSKKNNDQEITRLIAVLQQSEDPVAREMAAKSLTEFYDDRSFQALLAALHDQHLYVSRAAAKAFARRQDVRAVEPLLSALKTAIEKDKTFQAGDFAWALAKIGEPKAILPLISALSSKKPWIQREIQEALPLFGYEAIDPLLAALQDENPQIQSGVVPVLSALGPPSVPRLIEALVSDAPLIRVRVAEALGNLGDDRAVEPLIRATQDASEQVRVAATKALGGLGNEHAIEPLLTLLTDDSRYVQAQAAISLGKLGRPALPSLMIRLRDEKEELRDNAADALAFMGEIAIKPLLGALSDSDWPVRQAAATSLGRLTNRNRISFTNKPDHEVIVESLLAGMNDPNFRVRKAVAIALGYDNNLTAAQFENVIKSLLAMLQRKQELARQDAADALLQITVSGSGAWGDDKRTLSNSIVSALKHPDDAVRLAIINAIRNDIDEIDVQRDLFPGWFPVNKGFDQVMIGKLASVIVQMLVQLTRDPNKQIREGALSALQTIREKLQQERVRGQANILYSLDPHGGPPPIQLHIELNEERAAAEAIEVAALSKPAPRYADFAFYDTGKILTKKIPDEYTLRSEQWYQLEVAVRVKTTGIPPKKRRGPIKETRQKEAVTVLVTAEGDGFEIEEPVQTLILPPLGDSTKNANFRVRPLRQSASSEDLAAIRVRLYYQFNLIEVAVIYAEVCGKFDSPVQSRLGLEKPISFQQERIECEYRDFDDVRPRAMHIDITKREETIVLHFAFYNDLEQAVVFIAPVRLQATDLEDDLMSIRKSWYDIALSKTFSEQVEGDEDEFLENMRNLARIGRRLWVKLFKSEVGSSLYQIGTWLEEHPLKEGSLIQISVEKDAANFIFPWTLMYDRPLPKKDYELPEPEGFWGIRYRIEQQLPGTIRDPDKPIHIEDRLKLEFMLWEQFRNAKLENALMDQLKAQSVGKLEISTPPITNADTCYGILNDCNSHILYFYTHGYTRHREADLGVGPNLELFKRRYESLDKDSSLRETYKLLYESIKQGKFEPDRSWIELTLGRIYLDELYDYIAHLQSKPFVILNMCESAQVTPSLSDSFIHFFLNRGASGVIGTECPMTVEFAHPFAEMMLKEILAGREVGVALLNARRHFMELKNPLGLAYTLFGSATVSFEPAMF